MAPKLKCILLVDDDEATNLLHRRLIEWTGAAEVVHAVDNGTDGLDYLAHRGDFRANGTTFPSPDLVLLDINMPGMNGWEFLEEFKRLNVAAPRVILVTASPNPDDKRRAESLSELDDFVIKPMTRSLLQELITKHFAETRA